jgi:predicted permease
MGRLVRRLRYWLGQDDHEAALAEELEFHRALKQQQLEADGVPTLEAQFAARRAVGNLTQAREDARAQWIWPWLDSTWLDLRYAVRGLIATPSFALPALSVLAITMGLTTSVYAIVDSVLLRPWPLPDPDRVVSVTPQRLVDRGGSRYTIYSNSYSEYRYLRTEARTVDLVGYARVEFQIEGGSESDGRLVSGNFFDALGIGIAAGRGLQLDDDVPGAPPVVVIGHGLWQRRFGGVDAAIGSVLRVNDVPFIVVGVAEQGARDVRRGVPPVAWFPFRARALLWPKSPDNDRFLADPAWSGVDIVGRLRPGVDRRAAEEEITVLDQRFAGAHGLEPAERIELTSTAYVEGPFAGSAIRIYSLFSIAIVLTLFLGCANVGNLQLARAVSRRMDVSVRRALGASRGRLVRQLLTEGLVLSSVAAACSVLVARYLLPLAMQRLDPAVAEGVTVDGRTILFAASLALMTCLLSGTLPAMKATSVTTGGRAKGRASSRLRAGLLGAQIAISLILLVGAGLLARAVHHAAGAGLGFTLDRLTVIRVGLPRDRYSPAERERISSAILDMLRRSTDGAVAGSAFPPLLGYYATRGIRLPGDDVSRPASRVPIAIPQSVTPEYFGILGIPLVAGDMFTETSPPDDVVVNATLAQQLWPGGNVIGRVFLDNERDEGRREKRVVGVVADSKSQVISWAIPEYYQRAEGSPILLFRADIASFDVVRRLIQSVAPDATPEVLDLRARLREQIEPSLVGAVAAAAVALLALLLASVGTLGVFSFLVNERIPEIGVRKALGARANQVVLLLLAGVSWPLVGGFAAGLLGAQALGAILDANLHGISPRDPMAYAIVFTVLTTTAFLALLGPARRAVRVDPASMLRAE